MPKPKHRRKARSTVLQTAAAAAKERDQDTARLINQALEGGNVVGTAHLKLLLLAPITWC